MHRLASATLGVVLLTALALAPPASAASRLIIRGHGFGHGIGMSQYGALGYAEHGYGYRDILGHYYEQTTISQLSPTPDVRVLLQSGSRVVVSGVVAAGQRTLNPLRTYTAAARGARVALFSATGHRIGVYDAPLSLEAPQDGALTLRGTAANGVRNGSYRGVLELRVSGRRLQAINALGLEDYVRGVVSAESPSAWPADALKAQAVAARTYAVTTNVGTPTDGIDQYADTRSQMYKGVAAEYPSTDAAVAATAGQIVTQNGRPVTTYFFSTSGGRTENVEFSFLGALPRPWLKGVDDPFDSVSPKHTWGPITLSAKQVKSKLRGLIRGSFRGITVTQRGTSPRIVRAEVVGTGGVTPVTGPQLRTRFGLFDTWATFTYISSDATPAPDPSTALTTPPTNPATPVPPSPITGGTPPTAPPADPDTGGTSTTGAPVAAVAALRPRILHGRITGLATGATLTVQQRIDHRWHSLRTTRLLADGHYRVALPGPGAFRIAHGALTGPLVHSR